MKFEKIILPVLMGLLILAGCEKKVAAETETVPAENTEIAASVVKSSLFGAPIKFSTIDLDGNKQNESIFKKADITMINVWATWCGPCRGELPEIGEVAKSIKSKNGQVISIIHDAHMNMDDVKERQVLVKNMLNDANCDYVTLVNNTSFDPIFQDIQGFPTTFFVDKDGNIIGEPLLGGRNKAQFEAAFEAALKKIKK